MKKRLFGILLSLALMIGMMPVLGLSQTAYATTYDSGTVSLFNLNPGDVLKSDVTVESFYPWSMSVYEDDTPLQSYVFLYKTEKNYSVSRIGGPYDSPKYKLFLTPYVDVTGVSLDKTTEQTINVGGKVSFTASIDPDNATDKTVKWSCTNEVKLYSDVDCTTEVGSAATDKLTVYAKGISEGSATVTATSNADSTKRMYFRKVIITTKYASHLQMVKILLP